jgi:hypothetical protein
LRHRLENHGVTDRVHIVLDCVVDEWLAGLLEQSGYQPRQPDFWESRGIRPRDLDKVIAALREMGTDAALAQACELEAARAALPIA